MQWNSLPISAVRAQGLATLGVFLCLGASLTLWTLHWPSSAPVLTAPRLAQAADALPAADAGALAPMLGAARTTSTPTASPSGALRLVGVVARGNGAGAALISPEGQAPKSFAVGSTVPGGWILQSVGPRQAALSTSLQGPVTLTLELPPPAGK